MVHDALALEQVAAEVGLEVAALEALVNEALVGSVESSVRHFESLAARKSA